MTNHLEVWEMENAWGSGDKPWFAYCERIEALLGVADLDGSETEDDFSLDSAFSAYRAGISPEDYAKGRRA